MVKRPEDREHWYYRFSKRGASNRSIEQSCIWQRVPNDPRNMAEALREVRVLLGKGVAGKVKLEYLPEWAAETGEETR